ncbi:MAG: phosphoribosylglycinamide formyltransferase [Peptococcaceae bacterium]|nr:phosphoribosylglycinamide formyltransferase [Peptococcaceae bacterium]
MVKLKLGVLASGRGSNLQAIIDACETGAIPAEVLVVISDNADSIALERGKRHSIESIYVEPPAKGKKEEYELQIVEHLKRHGVELVCLAGYMRMLSNTLLDAFKDKIINIHPSLLPAFKGLDAQVQAFDYGVRYTGCTVHFVELGMDSGSIILQSVVPVYQKDSKEDLAQRILEQEHIIYPRAITLFAEGRLELEGRKVIITEE